MTVDGLITELLKLVANVPGAGNLTATLRADSDLVYGVSIMYVANTVWHDGDVMFAQDVLVLETNPEKTNNDN